MFDIEELTIKKFHNALLSGKITCEEVTKLYLDRINKYDKQNAKLNSIILINENAINEAKTLDLYFKNNNKLIGELHGVCILLKDNCETYDMPTTAGSLSLKSFNTKKDAFIVQKLRKAGAIIIAKSNLHEFAIWGETVSSILGQTYNPYDHTRTPGGSSGGTGAGIAANFALVGIGTDTINSVRSPSSACSLCGIRPSIGLVSRDGIIPYSLTQDTVGPIARTVEDATKVLNVIVGYDKNDESTFEEKEKTHDYTKNLIKGYLQGKRIGILKSFMGSKEEHKEVNNCMINCFNILKEQGAILVDIEEKISSSHLVKDISLHLYDFKSDLYNYLIKYESPIHSLDDLLKSKKYTKDIEENVIYANKIEINSKEYKDRLEKRAELKKEILNLFDKYNIDAIIYPHQQQLVCKVGFQQEERNGAIASITGFPAIVVQAGFSSQSDDAPLGVPIGLEIMGKPFCEGEIISIAYSFEDCTHFRKKPIM
ncbi:MAG: amidase family protein [Eubacteriales bacterium]|nr:amidase family protein [Eubacteriales bacterium]